MKSKVSIITGITGQCGSYLADKLLGMGHTVIGIVRRTSDEYKWRLTDIINNKNLILCSGDVTDQNSINRIVYEYHPNYFYNAAAQSHVGLSYNQPVLTGEVTGLSVTKCLEAIREHAPECRFLQFSTSEMFGHAKETPQDENTPLEAVSPYAAAKIYGYHMTNLYAKSYNLFASNMIMFNTESPKRGLNFVTRKITNAVAKIVAKLQNELILWDLSPMRDWSYVGDTMDAAIKILDYYKSDTFVISSGETHSVEEFCKEAFECVGLDWRNYVKVDKSKARPSEVPILMGCSDKAKQLLNWCPKVSFKELVELMVYDDIYKIANKNNN